MKDKGYRVSFVGGEVGRFMRAFRWQDRTQNSLDTYEIVLSRLAVDFGHYTALEQFTTDNLRAFLEEHWGDSAPATRRNRLAINKSFFRYCVDERGPRRIPPTRSSLQRS